MYVLAHFVFSNTSNGDVKIEVLFKPEICTERSTKGKLLNAHYDGYLAKDGSQFYCRYLTQERLNH